MLLLIVLREHLKTKSSRFALTRRDGFVFGSGTSRNLATSLRSLNVPAVRAAYFDIGDVHATQ